MREVLCDYVECPLQEEMHIIFASDNLTRRFSHSFTTLAAISRPIFPAFVTTMAYATFVSGFTLA